MPKFDLGDSERMTLLAWSVEEGEEISEGQIVLEVETDKAAMEVEAPFDGVLARKLYAEDDEVEPGVTLAWVAELGEDYDRDGLPGPPRAESQARARQAAAEAGPVQQASPPVAGDRSLGDGRAVSAGDLRGLSQRRLGPQAAGERVAGPSLDAEAEAAGSHERSALTRHRGAIARATSRSNEVPQFGVSRELAADPVRRAAETLRAVEPAATITDVLLLAVAGALQTVPNVNAWFDGQDVFHFERASIAVAVDGPDGVVAPVVRDVDALEPREVVAERARLVGAAREGTLKGDDLRGATFTVSNIGPLGADALLPMLTPPQVAILAIGRERDLGAGPTMNATFVGDHRIIDGADGARFLSALVARLDAMADSTPDSPGWRPRATIGQGRPSDPRVA